MLMCVKSQTDCLKLPGIAITRNTSGFCLLHHHTATELGPIAIAALAGKLTGAVLCCAPPTQVQPGKPASNTYVLQKPGISGSCM